MRDSVRSSITVKALIALLIPAQVLCADPSAAQPQVTIPNPLTITLRAPSVHRHLQLEPGQIGRITTELDKVETPLWRLRDLPEPQHSKVAASLLRKLTEAASHILLPRQLDRLNQLIIQAQGIRAVTTETMANRMNLTTTQQTAIREIIDGLDRRLLELNRAGLPALDSQAPGRLRMDAERRILDLLRPTQRQLLDRLMGPRFDFKTVPQVACRAPEIRGIEAWINSEPVTLAALRGKVVALHFYTFGCINCIRNLPHYSKWYDTFPADRFAVIGIHTPETQNEHIVEQVRSKAAEADMHYPIAVDNKKETWNAWANHVWPAVYLIDKQGFVRYWWYGELNWQKTEGEKWMRRRIQQLLNEGIEYEESEETKT